MTTSYAYIPPGGSRTEPLRAELLSPELPYSASDGLKVKVRIHHPDTGPREEALRIGDLLDPWDERPSERCWPGYRSEHTWADIAEQRHAYIVAERQLADRLTELGLPRRHRHYAGSGGTSDNWGGEDARIVLSHEELDRLLTLAEASEKRTNEQEETTKGAV